MQEVFETDRFQLRPLVRSDAAALFPTLSDDEQCLYMSRGAFRTVDELADWLVAPGWPGESWAAIDKVTGVLVGRFVLIPTDEPRMAEVSYVTVKEWQGRGVATECLTALVDLAFGARNQRRLIAEIDADNAASVGLIERVGFKREGHLRQHETTHRGVCDLLIYGLLRDEWRPAS